MTTKSKTLTRKLSDVLLLLISGLGIGWLIGLSVSPVLHIIVGSIIALVAAAVGSLIGLRRESEDSAQPPGSDMRSSVVPSPKNILPITPLPLTILVIGLVIGSSVGIYARTNGFFGPNPQRFARQWAGTGLDEKEIQKRLFNHLYPSRSRGSADTGDHGSESNTQNTNEETTSETSENKKNRINNSQGSASEPLETSESSKQLTAGLFALTIEECDPLILKHGQELRTLLTALNKPRITTLVDECKNDACVERVKRLVCPRTK